MRVYVFGNEDVREDNIAFRVAKKQEGKIKNVEFVKVLPNQDLPFAEGQEGLVVIMDAVLGLEKVTLITDINKLILSPRTTVHDFDLVFQLKYLKKINKLKQVAIIGLPVNEAKIDYFLIQSILRKLVAQDMQGS